MIKNNKKQLVISSIIILLPIIVGMLIWNYLPDQIVTHWSADGDLDGFGGKAFAIFVIPMVLFVLHWALIFLTAYDPKNKGQSRKVFNMALWIFPIISLVACGLTYAIALGNDIDINLIVRVLIGLMFLVIGNYMPKCKQNHTIGVKVVWTLRNEENWNKTHRFTGKLWVFGGVLILATIFIPIKYFPIILFLLVLFMAFVPMIYSYVYYRKQIKAGTATKADGTMTSSEKKMTKVSLGIVIIILIFVSMLFFTGKFEVQFGEGSFTIEAVYWNNVTVKYNDIDNIEYRKQDDSGMRTFGYGTPFLLMGEFENSEFGDYTRYSYTSCDSCVVVTVDEKILVINGKDEKSTKEIYDKLSKRVN